MMPGVLQSLRSAGGKDVYLDVGLTRQYGFTLPPTHEAISSFIPEKMVNALNQSKQISVWPMTDGHYMAGTLNTNHVFDSNSLYNFHGKIPGQPLTSIYTLFRHIATDMIKGKEGTVMMGGSPTKYCTIVDNISESGTNSSAECRSIVSAWMQMMGYSVHHSLPLILESGYQGDYTRESSYISNLQIGSACIAYPRVSGTICAPGVSYVAVGIRLDGIQAIRDGNTQVNYPGRDFNGLLMLMDQDLGLDNALKLCNYIGVVPSTDYAQNAGQVLWMGIPVKDDGTLTQRFYVQPMPHNGVTAMYANTASLHTDGFNPDIYKSSASVEQSLHVLSDHYRSLTEQEIVGWNKATARNKLVSFYPVIGWTGGLDWVAELQSSDEIVSEVDGGQVISAQATMIGTKVTREWYEQYLTTGLGVKKPLKTARRQAVLDSWDAKSVTSMGAVTYSTSIGVGKFLIDQLDVRKEYARACKRSCRLDDFYKQQAFEGYTWARIANILDLRLRESSFFVLNTGLLGDAMPIVEVDSAEYVKNADGSYTRTVGTEVTTVAASDILSQMASDAEKGLLSARTIPNDIVKGSEFETEFNSKQAEANKTLGEYNVYSSLDPKLIGINMLRTYRFANLSLSVSGYPMVKTMPTQMAIMAIIRAIT